MLIKVFVLHQLELELEQPKQGLELEPHPIHQQFVKPHCGNQYSIELTT